MIFNVNDLFVEIEGELFPAGNIQIWPEHPELHWSTEHSVYYGVYFEMMFEDGCALIVSQEIAEEWSKGYISAIDCNDVDHYLVEFKHMKDGFKVTRWAEHCTSESDLASTLKKEVEQHKKQNSMSQWVA